MNNLFDPSYIDDTNFVKSTYTNEENEEFMEDVDDEDMEEISSDSKILTPIKAIRAKCMDCCCYQRNEVAACPCTNCPLWPYRFGKRPVIEGQEKKKKNLTDEQRAKLSEKMKKMQEARKKKREESGK